MFVMLELVADLRDLREIGLTEEEIAGYLEMYLENYGTLFSEAEVV